jgi:polysaccharide deacetylase family protein (PEP-CTERM system associated)
MLNALTVDVEEHFQAHAYERVVDRAAWNRLPSRVVGNTRRLLALFAAHGVRATFFVLGWVAERHPELVREIVAAGHELGSHGHAHQLLYRQTPEDFAADLGRSVHALRAAAGDGAALLGYRAPAFSLTTDTLWALRILREHGFRYDSSLLPVDARAAARPSRLRGGKRYGVQGASRFASRVDGGLWEFPVSTVRVAGRTLPVAGGGFLRLLPLALTRGALRRIHAEGQPAIVYLHPWEIDADEPPIAGAPALARFRHRVNVGRTEARLRHLLVELRFAPLREVFAAQLAHA